MSPGHLLGVLESTEPIPSLPLPRLPLRIQLLSKPRSHPENKCQSHHAGVLYSLKNTRRSLPSTQLLMNTLHPASIGEHTVYSAPTEGETGNPGRHLATEEHTLHMTQSPVHTGHASLEQHSVLGGKNKGITPAEMRRTQGYVGRVRGGLVFVGGGNFWTDVWAPWLISICHHSQTA